MEKVILVTVSDELRRIPHQHCGRILLFEDKTKKKNTLHFAQHTLKSTADSQ